MSYKNYFVSIKYLLISKRKILIFAILCSFLSIFFSIEILFFRYSLSYLFSLFLVYILGILIASVVLFKQKLDIFEPIYLYSIHYATFIISGIYLLRTKFYNDVFIQQGFGYKEAHLLKLFNISFIHIILGFIFFALGYYIFITKKNVKKVDFQFTKVSKKLLKIFIIIYIAIGVVNFFYVSTTVSDNPLIYLLEIGKQNTGESDPIALAGLTTIGYNFFYAAIYLWMFLIIQNPKKNNYFFWGFVLFSIIVIASKGRITQTVAYILSIMILHRYSSKKIDKYSPVYVYIMAYSIVGGIALLFLRQFSKVYLIITATGKTFEFKDISNFLSLEGFASVLIDNGNLPNIPVLMKIIQSWEKDIGFLHGRSFFNWIYTFIPFHENLTSESQRISFIIKKTWYIDLTSFGGLPPTGIGEMYANFGSTGVIIGMFLFGAICAGVYNFMQNYRSYWIVLIYSWLLTLFIFMHPKGEIANISTSIIWFMPTITTVIFIKLLTK